MAEVIADDSLLARELLWGLEVVLESWPIKREVVEMMFMMMMMMRMMMRMMMMMMMMMLTWWST